MTGPYGANASGEGPHSAHSQADSPSTTHWVQEVRCQLLLDRNLAGFPLAMRWAHWPDSGRIRALNAATYCLSLSSVLAGQRRLSRSKTCLYISTDQMVVSQTQSLPVGPRTGHMPREPRDTQGRSRSATPACSLLMDCLVGERTTQPIFQAGDTDQRVARPGLLPGVQ